VPGRAATCSFHRTHSLTLNPNKTRPHPHQHLYAQGAGGIWIGPIDGAEAAACPTGVSPQAGGQQTALVVMAGAGSAGRLQATLQELLGVLGRAGEEVRGLFHLYVGVVSGWGLRVAGLGCGAVRF